MEAAILFEDKEIIVAKKPAGMLSQGNRSSAADMVSYLKNYLYNQGGIKGEPYIGLIHRLDRPVGGIMVFAKTPKSAGILSRQIQNNQMIKKYQAVLTGELTEKSARLTNYLVKDTRTNLSKVVPKDTRGSKKAVLDYQVLQFERTAGRIYTLALIKLITGRHHQIRVQMVNAGAGVYGDTKYNPLFAEQKGWFDMGLFAYSLELNHPLTDQRLKFHCQPEGEVFAHFNTSGIGLDR